MSAYALWTPSNAAALSFVATGSYTTTAFSDSQLSRDKIVNQDTAAMKVVLKGKSW